MSRHAAKEILKTFRETGRVLGLFQLSGDEWEFNPRTGATGGGRPGESGGPLVVEPTDPEIEQLITERNQARRSKDFAKADEIRKRLAQRGITIEDRPDGTSRWKR